MRSVFILFSLISFPSVGSTLEFDSIRSETRVDGLFVIHEVEEQETLYGIARRYGSSVGSILKFNEVIDNNIEIGQLLSVLVENKNSLSTAKIDTVAITMAGKHLVGKGETLYSISRKYGMKLKELRKLNGLESNDISPGQFLFITDSLIDEPEKIVEVDSVEIDENTIPIGFEAYLVQTGETLLSIADKKGVRLDSLKAWNSLSSDYLRIGQKLIVKERDVNAPVDSTFTNSQLNEDGFERVYESGIAAVISDISTKKYLALHRFLPIGTELKIRNLMNNLVVHVKVVGKLPNTGINKNVLVRLSTPAFEQLGILDAKSRVEVSYFK